MSPALHPPGRPSPNSYLKYTRYYLCMDQPGMIVNPARGLGQLNTKINQSLSPFAPENLVSRDSFGRPIPCQPAQSPHSGSIWCLLTGFLPLSATASNRHTPSGQSRVYRVTRLRSDDIHCRESTGTGPVVPNVVRVTGAAFAGITIDHLMCASLFSPSTCPLHTNSGCGKERRILIGPW